MVEKLNTNVTKNQTKLIEALIKKWETCQDERFCQMLFNYSRIGTRGETGYIRDIFHYQDDDIINDLNDEEAKRTHR